MDEFESVDEESPDRYSPSRRSVLKAIGVTATVGTLGTGVVGAQEGPGGNCVLGTPGEGCNAYTQSSGNEISADGLPTTVDGVTISLSGGGVVLSYDSSQVTVQELGVKGGPDGCLTYPSPESGVVYFAPNTPSGNPAEVSNVAIIICPANGEECPLTAPVKFEWDGTQFVAEGDDYGITLTLAQSKDGEENEPIAATWTSPYCIEPVGLKAGQNTNFNSSAGGTSGTVDVIFNEVTSGRNVSAISNVSFDCC